MDLMLTESLFKTAMVLKMRQSNSVLDVVILDGCVDDPNTNMTVII